LISVPIAILIGTIMLANNIRDLENDKLSGRKTIAILLGHKNAVKLFALLFIITYLWTLGLIIIGILPILSLLVSLSISKAICVIQCYFGKKMPIEMIILLINIGQIFTINNILIDISLFIYL